MESNKNKFIENLLVYYTEDNLNRITRKIIESYREKRYSYIIGLSNLIDTSLVKNSQNIQKLFSQLVLLYHPDRTNFYKSEIAKLFLQKADDELQKYTHIITVTENLDKIKYSIQNEQIDYDIEYKYGYDDEDFDSIITENNFEDERISDNHLFDFLSLLKYQEFGNIDEEFPSYYLTEMEGELVLSGCHLYDLSGLEQCVNITTLDLSNNRIIDIEQIGFLNQLTDINLSGNSIQSIDVLESLHNLQTIDISFNEIDDISSLVNLHKLKYVNIIGNNISQDQLDLFKNKDLVFIY